MSLSKKKIAGVSASDAEAVINFLNSATSAEEIAARIEIPAERDVGLNVARNLLEERAKLGNKFTNIEQVIRVQSIGPERLAEIIASLKKEIELKVISDIPPLIARNHNGFLAPGSPLCYTYPTPNRDNNEGEKKGGYSGFIIMRFASSVRSLEGDDIVEVARQNELGALLHLLEEYQQADIKSRRLVRSLAPRELLKLERKAATTKLPPLHSLTSYWRLDCRKLSEQEQEKLVRLLNELNGVDLAYREMQASDPVVNDADDTYAADQDYLDAAPTGIDARWAWTQTNGEGAGIGVVDLEQGWFPNHEDLVAKTPTLIFGANMDGVGMYKGNHGTAVLGEIVGVDNTMGVVGIAPAVTSVRMGSHYDATTNTNGHVADAIVAAIAAMAPGDLLLLEVQLNFLPAETDMGNFDAIRLAVASGIIVVEAAGNGGSNLDTWTNTTGDTVLNRGSPDFLESGAIMVGASVSTVPHNRWNSSNFGSRIDCYAWGENVVSAGYGDLDPGTGDNSTYTNTFQGTSSASPIITGAAIILQGMYQATTSTRLSPGQMRALLSNPTTGTPQGGGVVGNIGVMPNLRAIIEDTLGLVPDIYLRDYVGDAGLIPSTGAISASPDVIVVPAAVANSTTSFGEGSGTENSNILGYQVEAGQDNFIYVRMKNRGSSAANGATARVYWSEVSTLITPDTWNLIGTTSPVNVPVGDTLVVTDALPWVKNSIPGTGHYCFVALLNHAQDLAPPIPPVAGFDWDDFRALIRNHNNVTWRNFDVVNVVPDQADPAQIAFIVAGAPDKARLFDLEIMQRLPEDAKVWWQMPLGLYATLPKDLFGEAKIDKKNQTVTVLMPRLRNIPLCNVKIGRSARHKCKFLVQGAKGYKNGLHSIAIRQMFEAEEVGRVTRMLSTQQKK